VNAQEYILSKEAHNTS